MFPRGNLAKYCRRLHTRKFGETDPQFTKEKLEEALLPEIWEGKSGENLLSRLLSKKNLKKLLPEVASENLRETLPPVAAKEKSENRPGGYQEKFPEILLPEISM